MEYTKSIFICWIFSTIKRWRTVFPSPVQRGGFALWAGTAARENPPARHQYEKGCRSAAFSSVRLFTAALQQLLQPLTAPENIQISFQAVVGIHSQLAVDVAVVTLHRPRADEQQAGDVLDRIALGIVTALLSA